jgi:hypothetical protein
LSKSELGRPYVSPKPLVRKPIRYTFPLLRPGGERRGEGDGQRGHQEAAAVHAGMVGRMRAKVNAPLPVLC